MAVTPLRRLVALLACCSTLVLVPHPASAIDARPRLAVGEAGSGPAAWSVPTVAATSDVRWSDVPRGYWARTAIDFVGGTNGWMRDFKPAPDGRYEFRPDAPESRRLLARALVKAFAPGSDADPSITFSDLAPGERFHDVATVAVANGWLETRGEAFEPTAPVTVRDVHRALVLALGLRDVAQGAEAIHLRDGTPVPAPAGFGTLLIGMKLGLRYNHGDESLDVGPDDALSRAEVAWSLYRATTAPPSVRDALSRYADLRLPNLGPKMVAAVEWGLRSVGQPYIWGGDWAEASPSGYCCGFQPRGGFDCSGLVWWVMKRQASGWDNTPPRPYRGWDLPQRSSAQMAAIGKIAWKDIRPGDLLFYDGNRDGTVDHVDLYLGAGWALDSGSSNAGVTITRVANSWYEDHFVHARRLLGA